MSCLLLFFGIALVILGIAGIGLGLTSIGSTFFNTVSDAINPTAAELCKAGETLDQVAGPDEYTAGEGYRHTVRYFCVSAAGERREVTGEFVQGMLGQVFGSLPAMLLPMIGGCALAVGIFFTIIGAILSARRRVLASPPVVPQRYAFDFPPDPTSAPAPRASDANDLAAKLRQIEEARDSGLISEDEYQQKRQQIIDGM